MYLKQGFLILHDVISFLQHDVIGVAIFRRIITLNFGVRFEVGEAVTVVVRKRFQAILDLRLKMAEKYQLHRLVCKNHLDCTDMCKRKSQLHRNGSTYMYICMYMYSGPQYEMDIKYVKGFINGHLIYAARKILNYSSSNDFYR